MPVKLKDVTIESITQTEAKKMKLVKAVCKRAGMTLSLELPEVLSNRMNINETIEVHIDKKPIAMGEKARVYGEGIIFKIRREGPFELVATVGGLRFVFTASELTESERNTFENDRFYFALF